MSRFPDLAALKKLVAASALGEEKKKHETRCPPVLPYHQHRASSSLGHREHDGRDQAGKAETGQVKVPRLGRPEVSQTGQGEAGLGLGLKSEEHPDDGAGEPREVPALWAGQGGSSKGTPATMVASLGPGNASVSWLRDRSGGRGLNCGGGEPTLLPSRTRWVAAAVSLRTGTRDKDPG